MTSFYTEEELAKIGFADFGDNVLLSRKTSIYGANSISLGSNVRIDDFCILSGKIKIENYVHIAAGCYLFGGDAGISIESFSSLSSRCVLYAESDDFYGTALGNPTVPLQYRKVISEKIDIGKFVSLGTGCTVLPGAKVEEGVAIGAMSLVSKTLKAWGIYSGIHPCKRLMERKKDLLQHADSLCLADENETDAYSK